LERQSPALVRSEPTLMKIQAWINRVKGRMYKRYRMSLTRQEAMKIMRVAKQWEIEDTDPKGHLILKAKDTTSTTNCAPNDPVRTSIRLHVSPEEYRRFKDVVRGKGLTVCHAMSAYVQAVSEADERLGESPVIQIFNIFQGKPRSRLERDMATGIRLARRDPSTIQSSTRDRGAR